MFIESALTAMSGRLLTSVILLSDCVPPFIMYYENRTRGTLSAKKTYEHIACLLYYSWVTYVFLWFHLLSMRRVIYDGDVLFDQLLLH